MKRLKDGDEIAILPHLGASSSEVLEIKIVRHAGPVFIQLEDGRMFATADGAGLNTKGCVTMLTDEHRAALEQPRQ